MSGMEAVTLFQAWFTACLFWLSLSLGSLAILMIHGVTGGAWGEFAGGALRAATATLPLMALLFIPLGFGLESLFPWVREPLPDKAAYLNVPFFTVRTLTYFLIWVTLAAALKAWDIRLAGRRMIKKSAIGLMLYVLTVTLFAVDWIMSLEPHWYSTAIGLITAASQVVGGFALVVLIMGLSYRKSWSKKNIDQLEDLGNLLLAGVMFWAYVAFMEYLIIWEGDLSLEITWYLHRSEHGWQGVGVLLVLLYFVVPFLILPSRHAKRAPKVLALVAALALCGSLVNVWWLTRPAFQEHAGLPHWQDAAAVGGIGLLWFGVFFGFFRRSERD